jgi:putative sugar O-methyltransferase
MGGVLAAQIQGRKALAEIASGVPPSAEWTVALGWSTAVSADPRDRSPLATLARHDIAPPDALFLDGEELPTLDTDWRVVEELRGASSPRVLVAAPFSESAHLNLPTMQWSSEDLATFRTLPALRFTCPALTFDDPQRLRELQLVRWKDPAFFFDQVQSFQESFVGWGPRPTAGMRPIVNTYQCLYYVSVIASEIGHRARARVIEIGGGFGNFARVARLALPDLFSTHVIVDIPAMLQLQRFFLSAEFPDEAGPAREVSSGRFRFVPPDDMFLPEPADVVVATHSLSELDPRQVNNYLRRVVLPASVVFLAFQRKFFATQITYDWIVRRMLAAGFVVRRIDALAGRNTVGVLLRRGP